MPLLLICSFQSQNFICQASLLNLQLVIVFLHHIHETPYTHCFFSASPPQLPLISFLDQIYGPLNQILSPLSFCLRLTVVCFSIFTHLSSMQEWKKSSVTLRQDPTEYYVTTLSPLGTSSSRILVLPSYEKEFLSSPLLRQVYVCSVCVCSWICICMYRSLTSPFAVSFEVMPLLLLVDSEVVAAAFCEEHDVRQNASHL